MFNKLFKPNWQHPKPTVRLKAINQLEPNNENQQILIQLAQHDTDNEVRSQAIGRLEDIDALLSLLKAVQSDELTAALHQRLSQLLTGNDKASPSAEACTQYITQISDDALLSRLLDTTQNQTILLACLNQLDDEATCLSIALNSQHIATREAAAARITQPSLLRQLSKKARDKKVAQLARQVLKQHHEAEQEEAETQQQLNDLITQIHGLANQSVNPLYEARLHHLKTQWETLAKSANDTQRSQAEQGLQQATQQWQAHQAEEERQAAADMQQTCLAKLDKLFDRLSRQDWIHDKAQITAQYQSLASDWQNAAEAHQPEPADKAHFAERAASWEQLQIALAKLEQLQLADDADNKTQLLDELNAVWPINVAMLPLDKEANTETAAPQSNHKHGKPRHIGLLHALRRALKAHELKKANRVWARLEHELQEHPDAKSAKQAEQLKQQLDELRDWHAFAAKPKKEALCEKMEALVAKPLSHPEEQANAIQAVHEAWHELMSSDQDADQTLWERFKTASDAAYEPCREHFQELDAEKADNKTKREALCTQLSEFLDQQDWETVDAAALWPIRRQADKDWKALSPVHYTDVRDINKRFRQLLKTFDQHLHDISERHEATLQQLIKRFEALAKLDDSQAATREAKKLQTEWRAAGWVMPRTYRKLDKRQRKLCDQIFGKQRAERQQAKAEQNALADSLKEAINALDKQLKAKDSTADSIKAAVEHVEQQAEPEHANSLIKRKRNLLKQAIQKRQQLTEKAKWTQWHARIEQAPQADVKDPLLNLCVALEVINCCDSPADFQDARRAWQLNNMAQLMKSQTDSAQRSEQLLNEQAALIDQGLDNQSRTRLLSVIDQLANT